MTQPVTIRAAGAADTERVRALVHEAYARWVPVIGREPMPMRADFDQALRDHAIDLLYAGDQMVGLIEMILGDDHLYIENVAVAPAFQGRGFGQMLMAHAEEVAARGCLAEIRLRTNAAFARNIAIYRQLGYAFSREEPFMGGTTVHMRKRLA